MEILSESFSVFNCPSSIYLLKIERDITGAFGFSTFLLRFPNVTLHRHGNINGYNTGAETKSLFQTFV